MRTCLICQQDKVDHARLGGLIEPLLVPTHPWESVYINSISVLPKVGELGYIMIIVDRFYKYSIFVTAPTDCTAKEVARLFIIYVVKYWGIPESIISDSDPRFTGKF